MIRGSALLAAAVVFLATAAPARAQTVDTSAAGLRVVGIHFPGSTALDRARLAGALATRSTSCRSPLFILFCLVGDWSWSEQARYLDPEEVDRDARRLELLLEAWGYPRATVRPEVLPDGDEARIRFHVREGPPMVLRGLEVRGLDSFDPPIPRPRRYPLRPGEPYALPRLEQTVDWLEERMAERGHPFGSVDIGGDVDESASGARVTLDARPGPAAVYGPVRIEAQSPIDEAVVRERLSFREGEPYSLAEVTATEMALYDLPIVERAVVQPSVPQVPTGDRGDTVVIPVRVTVEARPLRGVDVEGTLSSTDCLTAAGFWRHRYFLGGPRLFSLGGGMSHLGASELAGGFPCTSTGTGVYARPQYFARAELRQPWPGSPRTQLLIAADAHRRAAPEVYTQRGWGAALAVSRRFGDGLTGMVRWAPSRNRISAADAYYCGNYGVCTEAGIEQLTGPSWLAPVEATLAWSPSGEPRQTVPPDTLAVRQLWGRAADWRYWASVGVEGAESWTLSDFPYFRTIVEGSATRPIGLAFEGAGHVRLGWLSGSNALPPNIRLYGGGVLGVRGAAENMLGAKVLVTSPGVAADLGCALATGGCPAGLGIGGDRISVRPTGGEALLEASLEGRWWVGGTFQLAAFVDYGLIRRESLVIEGLEALSGGWSSLLSPGVGFRVLTNLGPIRLDVAYDPSSVDRYPLFAPDADGLVYLGNVRYDPYGYDAPGFFTRALRRLQVHVGIGQAF